MTEQLLEIPATRCTQCGKTDTAPKAHVNHDQPGEASYHYDCLPFDLRDADPYIARAVELAESGTRNDDLRAALTEGI